MSDTWLMVRGLPFMEPYERSALGEEVEEKIPSLKCFGGGTDLNGSMNEDKWRSDVDFQVAEDAEVDGENLVAKVTEFLNQKYEGFSVRLRTAT